MFDWCMTSFKKIPLGDFNALQTFTVKFFLHKKNNDKFSSYLDKKIVQISAL